MQWCDDKLAKISRALTNLQQKYAVLDIDHPLADQLQMVRVVKVNNTMLKAETAKMRVTLKSLQDAYFHVHDLSETDSIINQYITLAKFKV